jgi:hypothetical protein
MFFELNYLPYVGYPGDDDAVVGDRRGKRAVAAVDEGPSRGEVPAAANKKRKLGTTTEGLGASDRFVVDLLGTCVAPGERMSSPELQESSAHHWRPPPVNPFRPLSASIDLRHATKESFSNRGCCSAAAGPEPGDPFSSGGPKPEEESRQSNASGGRLGPRNQEYGDASSAGATEEGKDGSPS